MIKMQVNIWADWGGL